MRFVGCSRHHLLPSLATSLISSLIRQNLSVEVLGKTEMFEEMPGMGIKGTVTNLDQIISPGKKCIVSKPTDSYLESKHGDLEIRITG